MEYTIQPLPRSYLRRVVDLYKEHMLVGTTEPGFMGWRVNRQFSMYWENGGSVLGSFDPSGKIVGFIAWKIERTLDPYKRLNVKFDDEKQRYIVAEKICWHDQLLIVPEHRGKGLGRKLMEKMFSMVETRLIRNICHEEWLVKYYESMGFVNMYYGVVPQNVDQIYWINERRSNGS